MDGCQVRRPQSNYSIDNIRADHADYVAHEKILSMMAAQGLSLVRHQPIRAGRWWLLYAIRYGLVPNFLFSRIAEYEVRVRAEQKQWSRSSYRNELFIFQKSVPE